MEKYGFLSRIHAPGFGDNVDDDNNDVNRDITRQAFKKKALKEIEKQQKKALEEDPLVFDYDGVYEQMKEAAVRRSVQDCQGREAKYIPGCIKNAEEREWDYEIMYEKKLAKERSKDEHLHAHKDKFVTPAFAKKLAERDEWLQEKRLRELCEEKDDVTKKTNIMLDFSFNHWKNVAFGAKKTTVSNAQVKQEKKTNCEPRAKKIFPKINSPSNTEKVAFVTFTHSVTKTDSPDVKRAMNSLSKGNFVAEQHSAGKKDQDHCDDALASAKERYLARKEAKISRYI